MDNSAPPSKFRRILRAALLGAAALGVLSSPWWVRAGARSMAFFHARKVEIEGRVTSPPTKSFRA